MSALLLLGIIIVLLVVVVALVLRTSWFADCRKRLPAVVRDVSTSIHRSAVITSPGQPGRNGYLRGSVRDAPAIASYLARNGVQQAFDPKEARSSAEFITLFQAAVGHESHLHPRNTLLIVSCHGTETGHLVLQGPHGNETFAPERLFAEWAALKPHAGSRLYLVVDACYSGEWVVQATKALSRKLPYMAQIAIQAVCSPLEQTLDKPSWSSDWLTNQTKPFFSETHRTSQKCFVGWEDGATTTAARFPSGHSLQFFSFQFVSFWSWIVAGVT